MFTVFLGVTHLSVIFTPHPPDVKCSHCSVHYSILGVFNIGAKTSFIIPIYLNHPNARKVMEGHL